MRYVAAYLLAVLGGNSNPCESDLKNILGSVGVGFDEEKACLVCKNLAGKNIEELIEAGKSKMASMPAGGAAPSGGASAGAAGADAGAEEKKEEKKEESEEESDDDMGFGLFD